MGSKNLNGVDMLINASYNNVNACWLYLDENKQLWLANDDISNWTYVTVGSSSVIQNSQCSISGTSFTASESGKTLSGTFTVGFTPAFAGAKTIYLQSVDAAGNQRGYTTQGTWTVQ